MRGTPSAYEALLTSELNKPSDDTLYFISNPEDDNAVLYLGSKLIANGDDLASSSIDNLKDVLINNSHLKDKSLLVYDLEKELWVNQSFENLVFVGATESSGGISGLVPAPDVKQTNAFLCSDGTWVELEDTQITGDNLSITINDEVVSLNNYGVKYYKYVAENDGDKYTLQIVDEDNPWIAGLEPKVTLEDEQLVIGWYEPSPTTIEEVNTQVINLQSTINNLKNMVGQPANEENNNAASGIYAELENKANSDDVYNKEAIDTAIEQLQFNIEEILDTKADTDKVTESFELVTEELSKKADKEAVYTKEETDLQVKTAIANADHLKRKEVASIEEIDVEAADATTYIYMVPSGLNDDDNKYYEYMVIETEIVDEENISTSIRKIEQVGSWEVNLSDYAKKTELTTVKNDLIEELKKKVDKVYYTVTNEDGTTSQVEGTLLTPEEKEKLSALSIDEDGSVGISGTVSVENVQGLSTWLTDNGDVYIKDLTEDNFSQETADKINYITAVDEEKFTVDAGTLGLKAVPKTLVTGLTENLNTINGNLSAVEKRVLNLEDTVITVDVFNKTVGNLETLLTSNTTILAQIEDINSRLTWQELDGI